MPRGIGSGENRLAPSHPRSELVERFVSDHGTALMRVARLHAGNAADADDAYQRTLEVMLTKAPDSADDDSLMAWASTVARNEALMQHRRRKRLTHDSFEEISKSWVDAPAGPDERLVESERLGHGREALMRLTPDQTRLLLLRADGLGYDEICELTGYSYAKVNRLLCEGRKAFRRRVERLDSGAECRRIEGVLSMIADGEARDEARLDAELHLAGCVACQATLREFSSAPSRAAEMLPLGALAGGAAGDWLQRAGELLQSFGANLQERLAGLGAGAGQGAEMAFAKKAVVATAVTATLVAGGTGMEKVIGDDRAAAGTPQLQLPTPDLPPSGEVGPSATGGPSGDASTAAVGKPRDVDERDLEGTDPVVKPVPAPPVDQDAEVAPAPEDSQPPPGAAPGAAPAPGGVSP